MTLSFSWWALPIFVFLYSMYLTRKLMVSDLFSMIVAGGFSAGMGIAAALLTVLVWGITK